MRLIGVLPTPHFLRVSIHAPREGCDSSSNPTRVRSKSFNSRTPGGVRLVGKCQLSVYVDVSIHAPREGCDSGTLLPVSHLGVSIHAPREGCDLIAVTPSLNHFLFQFTHPGRGATYVYGYAFRYFKVSIHAPREGCDGLILPRDL